MFRKLIEFNWKVFKSNLTAASIAVIVLYSFLLLLLFYNTAEVVYAVISMQSDPELSDRFKWLTPQMAQLILLLFVNLLWIAQFFFTSGRQLQLQKNRKLLTVGYPVYRLARDLTIIGFFHPINLLFNTLWFLLMYQLAPGPQFIPVIVLLIGVNFGIIFSIKFRFLRVLKDYYKWIFLTGGLLLFMAGINLRETLTLETLSKLQDYIPAANAILVWLPGNMIKSMIDISALSIWWHLFIAFFCVCSLYALAVDHFRNTKQGLQTSSTDDRNYSTSRFLDWLCNIFGRQSGKYLYYIASHPYNRVQALFFILFPVFYLSVALDAPQIRPSAAFVVLFFMMYVPLGFLMLGAGNIFGYEHRELLLHLQGPIHLPDLVKSRVMGALFLPLSALLLICLIELVVFRGSPYLFSFIAGNIFVFLFLALFFLWSSFHQFKKIPWITFTYAQPIVSKSVAMVSGLLMFILSLIVFIPFGSYEFYKQIVLSVGILLMSVILYRYINYSVNRTFKANILPRLWTEL